MPDLFEKGNPFADMEIISRYTWDNAVEDGTKIEVTGLARKCGLRIPAAVSVGLFSEHLRVQDEHGNENTKETENNIICLLLGLIKKIKEAKADIPMITFEEDFGNGVPIKCFASIEGRTPENPEPVITIYLPEEY